MQPHPHLQRVHPHIIHLQSGTLFRVRIEIPRVQPLLTSLPELTGRIWRTVQPWFARLVVEFGKIGATTNRQTHDQIEFAIEWRIQVAALPRIRTGEIAAIEETLRRFNRAEPFVVQTESDVRWKMHKLHEYNVVMWATVITTYSASTPTGTNESLRIVVPLHFVRCTLARTRSNWDVCHNAPANWCDRRQCFCRWTPDTHCPEIPQCSLCPTCNRPRMRRPWAASTNRCAAIRLMAFLHEFLRVRIWRRIDYAFRAGHFERAVQCALRSNYVCNRRCSWKANDNAPVSSEPFTAETCQLLRNYFGRVIVPHVSKLGKSRILKVGCRISLLFFVYEFRSLSVYIWNSPFYE